MQTPLFSAAEGGFADVCSTLIQFNASVKDVDKENRTPLHLAALQGNLPVVSLLLANGAQIEAEDNDGRTAMHYATYYFFKVILIT
jgi:ankyrin repeat protein